MITRAQANKITALAGVLATARVRRYAVRKHPKQVWTSETITSTQRAAKRASEALASYLENLVDDPNPTAQEPGTESTPD